ncbi:hypothetical protein M8494_02440 [Serratia ureilytica]
MTYSEAMSGDTINDLATLEQLAANPPRPRCFKVFCHPAYPPVYRAAPFSALSTVGPDGMDVSPRGDPAGFIHIEDEKTLLLPDRRGNNPHRQPAQYICTTTGWRCCC